jgi:type 1 glutamine amidotransferase
VRVLLVTGGHPFDREPFLAVFDANPDVEWTHLEQPEAAARLSTAAADADVVVFYDMPGVAFTGDEPPVRTPAPDPAVVDGFGSMTARGVPMVFLHHAIAGWPAWDDYARMIGGRFHYAAARFDGASYPDSGYAFDVTHRVEVVDAAHPVCRGVEAGFTLTDELYLFPVLESEVVPLLRSDATFTDEHFFSADLAIRGKRNSRDGWSHPPGSALVGWVKNAGRSPVVYLQFGDGPATYADENYRLVLANAIRWAGSPEARRWVSHRSP